MINIQINLGNCLDGLKQQPSESVDCIITSPPYKDIDKFDYQNQLDIFTECARVMKKDSLCFINFGHLAEQKSRPFRLVTLLEDNIKDFNLQETFTWHKAQYSPIQGNRRVNNLTEFIFMFSKGKMPIINRLAVGVPYADENNAKRYGGGKNLRCSGNYWYMPYETIHDRSQKLHNDRFPLELPTRCLKLANAKSDWLVLDPFSGSATTALACQQLGLNFIGWEINKNHYDIAINRLKK